MHGIAEFIGITGTKPAPDLIRGPVACSDPVLW